MTYETQKGQYIMSMEYILIIETLHVGEYTMIFIIHVRGLHIDEVVEKPTVACARGVTLGILL